MAEKRQLPTLHVVQIGESEFERYVIENQEDRVWTGEGFDSHLGSGDVGACIGVEMFNQSLQLPSPVALTDA